MRILVLIVCGLIGSLPAAATAADWTQFRGPTGLGYTADKSLPTNWGGTDETNLLWKSKLTGDGHASPIVLDDQVFVCTAHWPDPITDRKQSIPDHHVASYSLTDGRPLWDTVVPPGPWRRDDFRSGSGGGYAAPTPATDGKRIYVAFGSSVIAALDLKGGIVWRNEIKPHNFDVTVGSSPIVFEDSVLMLCAMTNKKDSRLIYYDAANGSIRREIPLPLAGFAHSTPTLVDVNGKLQLIIAASGGGEADGGIQSLDPRTGETLWTCRGGGEAASPAFGNGIVYCDNGRGGPGVAIDPTGSGDVTKTHVKWRVNQVPEGIGSPTIFEKRVYRLHTPNILKSWDAESGRQVYAQRLDKLTSSWASPIVDGTGKMFFATAGVSYVIQTGDDFQVLAINDLGDANHASPAVADGKLILVGSKHVFCVGSK